MKRLNKKGNASIEGLQGIVVPLIGVAIVLAIGFLIIAEARDQADQTEATNFPNCNYSDGLSANNGSQNYCGYAVNGSIKVQDALAGIPGWLPIIVITLIGSLLIGLVAVFGRARG